MGVKPKRGEVVELEIESLNSKGQGVARVGEYTVGVRAGLPGDRVRARIRRVRNRRRTAEARAEAFDREGTPRVRARCAHFGVCGGCLWQDVPYDAQVRLKQEMVARCLREAGVEADLAPPIPVEEPFFYRNKMEFSFGISPDGGVDVGLHAAGRFDRVFDLEACYLQSELSNQIVDRVRRFVRDRGLSAYHLKRHEGLLRFLTIREGKQTGETMVMLTTSGEEMPLAEELGEVLSAEFPGVKSVIQSINRRKAQVAIGDEERVLAGKPTILERLGDFVFEVSPGSFFQTNTVQAERLYGRLVELLAPRPHERVLDVYCGTGGISLFLSKYVQTVVGVESAESALKDAVRNSANNGVENCQFIAGQAEDVLGQILMQDERFDAAVTDPPRAGMHPRALQALSDLGPGRIVYVSCNPEALGGDLKRLEGAGYRVDVVQFVDMFPHTPHCEVLARLTREE